LAEQNSAVTRLGDPVFRATGEEGVGGKPDVVAPAEEVTTTPELLTNTVFLPNMQVGAAGISAVVDEANPAITVTDPVTPTSEPTATEQPDKEAPVDDTQ
jgi:hypothetical protein